MTATWKSDGAELACAYVDTTVWTAREVGAAHDRLAREGWIPDSPDALLLRTCERVEVYSTRGVAVSRSAHPFPAAAAGLGGHAAVCRRLTEIAAGVCSVVLGERFIAEQVEAAAGHLGAGNPLRAVVADAVCLAKKVRAEHDFAAPADYPDLVDHLLGKGRGSQGTLVVVGGGMLAQAVAGHPLAGRYRRVLAVTRAPKRLRKRLTGLPAQARSLAGARAELRESWDVVIATTNLVEPYRSKVAELVTGDGCRLAVDVSCVPLLGEPPADGYVNLYHPRFTELVDEQNARVAAAAERVRHAIAEQLAQPRLR